MRRLRKDGDAVKGLKPILNLWRLFYYRRALRQIHPLHPDVPYIVDRLNQLEHA